jgi:beta-lactam-binding protein with PASTA domain
MRRAEASQVLADSGFAVRVVVVPDSLRSDEEVIAQRPDSGIPRRPVTLVAIDVVDSVGPPPPRPRLMPRVLSMTRDEAAAALAFLSPRLTITERPTTKEEENGRVVDQYPLPDVPVFPDLEVLLAMGRYEPQSPDAGPAQVTQAIVPPLIGRSIAEARDLLAQANLRMGDLSSRYEAAPESVVVGQTPDSGAAVPPGTVVAVDLQPAAPGTGRIPPRNGGDNGIDWYWWLLIAGGVPVVYVVWRLIRDHSPDGRQSASPGVHAEVKQGRFEPPRVVRKDDDRLVAFEVTFVNRVPESTIELPGSLILREENL